MLGADRRAGLPPTGVVLLAVFAAGLDNYVVPPMLLGIGDAFDRSLASVATVVAGYTFAYGALQLGWGYVSGRLGRLNAVRLGLGIGVAATIGAAAAGDLTTLIVLRCIAGAAFASIYPSTIVYIGDQVPLERRVGALGNLVAAYAAGVAAGIVLGGVMSDVWSWRAGFGASAVVASVALGLQALYATDASQHRVAIGAFCRSLGRAIASPWPRAVALLTAVEGATLFGFLTFFPAALEDGGLSRRLAGLVVALYGVATALATRPARRLAGRLTRAQGLALGMLVGAAALALAAVSQAPAAIAVAAVLIALGFAIVHPLLQSWATVVMPSERPAAVSLWVAGLYVGTAITAQAASPFLGRIGYGWTFAIGAGLSVALAGMLAVTWRAYARAHPAPG